MQFYKLILAMFIRIALVDGRHGRRYMTFAISTDRLWMFGCDFEGYVPSGNVTNVGQIKAPVAKLAKKGIASVLSLGHVSQASTLSMHTLNTVKAVSSVFKNVAPALGPVLGVFGSVTGILKSVTDIKPKDIMDAVNNAVGKLTKDINDKITKMEGYVDSRVVNMEKDLILRDFASSFLLWKECAREVTLEYSNECQREAYATISAKRPKFAVFAAQIESGQTLTPFQTRQLEAYLIAFRDYANLILMMLKPLIQVYSVDNSTIAKRHYERYTADIKEQTEFFIRYAKDAVKMILKVHDGAKHAGVCPNTIHCGDVKIIKEGSFIAVHTANEYVCNCIINDGTKQLCNIMLTIRADGKLPTKGYKEYDYDNCTSEKCGANRFAETWLVRYARKWQKKNDKIARAYWQEQLLDFVPEWEKAIEFSSPVGDDEPSDARSDVNSDDDTDDFKFSERYPDRLAKALKETKELAKQIKKTGKSS